jgi:hypothetical protein
MIRSGDEQILRWWIRTCAVLFAFVVVAWAIVIVVS